MKYRKLDKDGDMIFGHNKYDFLIDKEAVAQAIKTKILLLRREWWEDVRTGTPMFTDIIGSKIVTNRKDAIDLILRDRILEVPNVETILDFKSEFDTVNRVYSMSCNVETSFGDTKVNIEFENY